MEKQSKDSNQLLIKQTIRYLKFSPSWCYFSQVKLKSRLISYLSNHNHCQAKVNHHHCHWAKTEFPISPGPGWSLSSAHRPQNLLSTPQDSAVPEYPGVWKCLVLALLLASGPPNTLFLTSLCVSSRAREYRLQLSHISDCTFLPPSSSLKPSTHCGEALG